MRSKEILLVFLIFIVGNVFFTGCIDSDDENDSGDQQDNGYTNFDIESMNSYVNNMSKDALSAEEEVGILYMREEEKLARDVYQTLYDKWQKNIFINIAVSEETHTQSVLSLIIKYNLTDPFIDEAGIFKNETLQNLYTSLINEGSSSLVDALKVGALIEELDIIDIQDYIDISDNQDIIFIYENLMMGSRNHLRSFVRTLKNEGVSYSPTYLSLNEFNEIIESGMETNQYRK